MGILFSHNLKGKIEMSGSLNMFDPEEMQENDRKVIDVLDEHEVLRRTLDLPEADPQPAAAVPAPQPAGEEKKEVQIRIGVVDGKIVLDFGMPVVNVYLNWRQAKDLSRSLRLCADALWNKVVR
jgi:hypothetical protein